MVLQMLLDYNSTDILILLCRIRCRRGVLFTFLSKMDLNKWKRLKRSGYYKRKVQKTYKQIIQVSGSSFVSGEERIVEIGEGSVQNSYSENFRQNDYINHSAQNDILSIKSDET